MIRDVTDEMMLKYEGLVICTVQRWRKQITTDMSDEDIQQELRIKIFRALQTFDPSFGYPEEKHVFGAVANRIKDLTGRTKKREFFETSIEGRQSTSIENQHDAGLMIYGAIRSSSGPLKTHYEDGSKSPLPSGMTDMQTTICIMSMQGYTNTEIQVSLGLTTGKFQTQLAKIKKAIRPQ